MSIYLMPPLTNGRILRRYKRFLADIHLTNGNTVIAHCPNTGAMTGCWREGAPVQLSHSSNPKRKLAWTLERVDMGMGWIGINTNRVNEIVTWAVSAGQIPQLIDYPQLDREPRINFPGFPSSRFDLLLSGDHRTPVYVEVKNTTLLTDNVIRFPDAVTSRGRKHLELLARAVRLGFRGVLLFALNRPEGRIFEPAWTVDRQYCDTLLEVHELGVEILIVRLRHTASGVEIAGSKLVSGRSA